MTSSISCNIVCLVMILLHYSLAVIKADYRSFWSSLTKDLQTKSFCVWVVWLVWHTQSIILHMREVNNVRFSKGL